MTPRKNSDILNQPLTQPTFEKRDINANEGWFKMSGFIVTPTSTDCIPEYTFERVKSRQVIVNFKGGTVTSDGGLTLIAGLDQKLKITSRLVACFQD